MAGFVGKRTEDLFLLGVAGGAWVDLKGSDVCGMMILVLCRVCILLEFNAFYAASTVRVCHISGSNTAQATRLYSFCEEPSGIPATEH